MRYDRLVSEEVRSLDADGRVADIADPNLMMEV